MPLQMEDCDIKQCVQVKIELGHRASLRAKPTKEGFTHDWTVYVRAPEGSNIAHFVEKVVFHLRDTYANPRRVVKEPPYYVSEVGYAGFGLPIEIYFKNKEEPQKIKFNYDLFLQMHEPVNYLRCEKLTFLNPADEFKKTLIEAGGVFVLPPGEAQFADLFGTPIKTEAPKKQKQPSTISSKEKVSEQMLNFSGDEKPSSSGKDISASLKFSAKQEKTDNSARDHDAASTSSSSSSSSTSKEKVQKTQSSRENHLSKDSNSSSKMVPNPSPLPSQKKPPDSPVPSENNQKKARRSSSVSSESVRSEDKQRSEEKAKQDKVVKHKSSGNKDESQSKSQDGKDSHKTDTSKQKSSQSSKVTPMEPKEDFFLSSDSSSQSDDDFFGESSGSDSDMDLDISPTSNTSKTSNQIYSLSALKKLMAELEDNSADDDDDITDTVDVSLQQKSSAINSPLVESGKASPALSCKSNSEKSYKAISENSSTIKKTTTPKDSQEKSSTKSVSEKKLESSNISDTRNKTQNGIQPPSPVPKTKKDENKSSKEKSSSKIDSIYDVKSQTKTVVKDHEVKKQTSDKRSKDTKDVKHDKKEVKEVKVDKKEVKAEKSSSSSESRKQDDKRNVEIKVNADKEEKYSKCEHSSSKSSSKGENDKKEKSSNRNMKFEITTDAKKSKSEHRKRSGSPISALDGSVAKKRRDSVKHLSKVTSVELKENLTLSSDNSSQSDDDFFGKSSGSNSDMDLDISPTSNTSKTSNQIYSLSALKKLMAELEDSSADDDDITDTVDVFLQQKSSAKNSPLVESGKASPALSCKSNSEKSYKAISENSSTIKKTTTPKDSQEKSSTKSVLEKKSESSDISDTRNKTQNGIQPPTKVPGPVPKTKKDENESSKKKSASKFDSINDVKSQIKTVVKDSEVKKQTSEERSKDTKEANKKEECLFASLIVKQIASLHL